MDMAITTTKSNQTTALVRLMTWLSPAFPVGAFAYSGGLEKAIEDRRIETADDLQNWLDGLLCHGALKTDAIFFSMSYKAGQAEELVEINTLALALAGSAERFHETTSLGAAFVDAAAEWPSKFAAGLRSSGNGKIAYPVAAGSMAGANETGLEAGIAAYIHASLSQLVSVAIRCALIGQKQGVKVLASLEPKIAVMAEAFADCGEDDLGSAATFADIASLRHETQVTRLFRS